MSFRVAPCADLDEFGRAIFAIGQYFGLDPTEERLERFSRNLPVERVHAAWEDDGIVGGAGAFPFRLSVPGGVVPTAGVTVVGTYPTHRRRGVMRSLMRVQLDDIHERGEPLALLWASEETIYGRFGYGMASLAGEMNLAREYSSFARPLERLATPRFVEAREALELFPRVYDRVCRTTPGMLARTRTWWELRTLFESSGGPFDPGTAKRYVVLERDGRPEAYAIYRHNPKFGDGVPDSETVVIEAIGEDGRPTAEIWRFLFDIDWSARITARLLPVDHPLFFLLATPRRMRFRIGDGLWARLVDVGAALSARTYAADGAIRFEVRDEFCPWNTGCWRLADGVAKRTASSGQLRLDVSALGAAYLGGFSFGQLVRAGRVEELTRGAAARADAMFASSRAPWCPEIF